MKKLLRRHTGKSISMDFVLHIESSGPWPPQYGNLAVQWHRGKRSGQTKPAAADTEDPQRSASYQFGEALVVPCTLYKHPEGGYEEKPLQLFIAQVDDRGNQLNVLGALELNVADFADVRGQARQEYPVECDVAICKSAGGRPMLLLAVSAARDGQSAASLAAEMAAAKEFPSSLSTDDESSLAPGSRRSSRVELQAADEASEAPTSPLPNPAQSAASRTAVQPPAAAASETRYDSDGFIIDDDDGPGITTGQSASVAGPGSSAAGESSVVKRNLVPAMERASAASASGSAAAMAGEGSEKSSPKPVNAAAPAQADTPPAALPGQDARGSARRFGRDGTASARRWAWRRQSDDPSSRSEGGGSGQGTPFAAGPLGAVAAPAAAAAGVQSAARQSYLWGPTRDPSRALSVLSVLSAGTPEVSALLDGAASASSPSAFDASDLELRSVAALESAVYLAGSGRSKARSGVLSLQAPARRLARTIIILGPQGGVAFGLRAVAAIHAAATACLDDTHRLVLWWSNVVTLRWSFWALCQGGTAGGKGSRGGTPEGGSAARSGPGGSQFDWLMTSLLPTLLQLEEALFSHSLELLWKGVLLRTATDSAGAATPTHPFRTLSNGAARHMAAPAAIDASAPEEGAVLHWTRALHAVDAELAAAARPPPAPRSHVGLLRRQLLLHLLSRLDALLFAHLLADGSAEGAPPLDPALLPFERGAPLTFTTGVQLKMATGRLANWAADVGVKEGPTPRAAAAAAAAAEDLAEVRLFPQLRAAADLVMMPKASLSDSAVLAEVASSLPMAAVCRVLQRFQPEGGSADERTPPELLKKLKAAAAAQSEGEAAAAEAWRLEQYAPTSEVVLLEEGLIQPLSLEVGEESDEELSALEERSGGGRRYQLLRELWGGRRGA